MAFSACNFAGLLQLPNESYVYDVFHYLGDTYRPIHPYLSGSICFLGTHVNVLNIMVLTRPSVLSPINVLLCAMAVCNALVTTSYLIFTVNFGFIGFIYCNTAAFSFGWGVFALLHAHLSLLGHSTSLWLAVCLAVIRYFTIKSRSIGRANTFIGIQGTVTLILSVFVSICLANLPSYICYSLQESPAEAVMPSNCKPAPNLTLYVPQPSVEGTHNDCRLLNTAFWITGVLFKFIPCLLLAFFMVLMLRVISAADKRRRLLYSQSTRGPRHRDRTTRMLLVLIALALFTEIPQGTIAIASSVFTNEFRVNIYNTLGDVLDLLSLINSTASFIIYCSMSRNFRRAFMRLFLPTRLRGQSWRRNASFRNGIYRRRFARPA